MGSGRYHPFNDETFDLSCDGLDGTACRQRAVYENIQYLAVKCDFDIEPPRRLALREIDAQACKEAIENGLKRLRGSDKKGLVKQPIKGSG